MKLVTYLREGAVMDCGEPGVLVGDRVLNLTSLETEFAAATGKTVSMTPSLLALLQMYGNPGIEIVAQALAWYSDAKTPASVKSYPVADVKLMAPIPRPTSMRDGYAFRQHVEAARRNRGVEMIEEFDLFPVFYFTNHQAVIGPGPMEVMPEHLKKLDYELEAAIVIGKVGRNISASEADSYIAGYTVMNDWSARYLQMEEMKLSLGPAKGKDFATAIGPWLVTRDELASRRIPGPKGERYDLTMTCAINGKEYSRGNLKDMSWTFAQIIERASYGVTLYPGDVIGSGTVGTGCLLELNGSKITDNLWIKVGDVVTCSIDMLGELTNNVVAAKQ
ncbi:MAG: fumarylacetoacetate hydrolase family protein [Candidatus Kapaibacterium sp.]|jgi:fumarylacetoacetate (FAA) hydrolase